MHTPYTTLLLITFLLLLNISCDSDSSTENEQIPPLSNDTLSDKLVGEWYTYHQLSKYSQTVTFNTDGGGSQLDTIFYGDTTTHLDEFNWHVEQNILVVTDPSKFQYRFSVVIDDGRLICRYADTNELWDFYVNTSRQFNEISKNVDFVLPENWIDDGVPNPYFIHTAYRSATDTLSYAFMTIEKESARGYSLERFYPLALEWWKKTVERGNTKNVQVISESDITVNSFDAKEWQYNYDWDLGNEIYHRKGVRRTIVVDGIAYYFTLEGDENIFATCLGEFNTICSTVTLTN